MLDNNIAGGCQDVVNENVTRAFKSDTASKRYFYNVNKHPAAGELEYYVSGTYVWDISTGKITNVSGGGVNITRCSFGAAWTHSTDNMSGNAKIANDKFSVTFSGSFHLKVTLGFSLGDFPVGWTVDCGSYSGYATGYSHA